MRRNAVTAELRVERKLPLTTVVLFAMVLTAAGCGSSSSSNKATATPSAAPTATPSAAPTATPTPSVKAALFVLSSCNGQVMAYPSGASGNVAPISPGADLCAASYDAYDSKGDLYVASGNLGANFNGINEYAPGSNGNSAPIATIAGPNTGLTGSLNAIAVDSLGNIYVVLVNSNVNPSVSSVLEYAAGSNGNVAPIATITGPNTGLVEAQALAVDKSGKIYVGNINSGGGSLAGSITVYAVGSNGNVAPIANISGSNTALLPAGLAVDVSGNIYALNSVNAVTSTPASITEYPAGSNGNVAPSVTISGSNTMLAGRPLGISLDSGGDMFVTDGAAVLEFSAGSTGNVAPVATISGPGTHLGLPVGIAIQQSNGDIAVVEMGFVQRSSEIAVFAAGANGNVTPSRLITSASLGLTGTGDVAVDAAGNIYVSNGAGTNGGSIVVYAAGTNANAVPARVIAGSNTTINNPVSIAVDSTSIYVANCNSNDVLVFPLAANGNVAPSATISGNNTGLSCPAGIGLDGSDNIYVANDNTSSVTEYAAGSSGNVAPIATISGSNTNLSFPLGMAVDAAGKIYVTTFNTNPPGIAVFAAGSNGNVAPIQMIVGPNTGFVTGQPTYVAVDSAGNIYANGTGTEVQVFAPGSNGNATPSATLGGPLTQLDNPGGVAVAP